MDTFLFIAPYLRKSWEKIKETDEGLYLKSKPKTKREIIIKKNVEMTKKMKETFPLITCIEAAEIVELKRNRTDFRLHVAHEELYFYLTVYDILNTEKMAKTIMHIDNCSENFISLNPRAILIKEIADAFKKIIEEHHTVRLYTVTGMLQIEYDETLKKLFEEKVT